MADTEAAETTTDADINTLATPLKIPRQERFAQFLAQGNTYEKAYELAGYEPDRSNAYNLAQQQAVKTRVRQLQLDYATEAGLTVGQLLRELEYSRLRALELETPQTSAAISATMGKAKIAGFLDRAPQMPEMPDDDRGLMDDRAAARRVAHMLLRAASAPVMLPE